MPGAPGARRELVQVSPAGAGKQLRTWFTSSVPVIMESGFTKGSADC
jgi:hypothetical protein